MKRILSISAILFTILTACDKTPLPPADEEHHDFIMFSTPEVKLTSETDTRSRIEGSVLPSGSTFGVWGYCVAYSPGTTNAVDESSRSSEWAIKKKLCPPTLFTPVSSLTGGLLGVTVGDDGCTYTNNNSAANTGNGAMPWLTDENSLYTFVAVYPTTANGLSFDFTKQNGANVDAPIIKYSVPYSGEVTNHSDTPDIMVAWRENHRKSDGHVPLTFYHLMSSLSVRVNNYSEYYDADDNHQGTNLKIHSIKLQGTFHKTLTVDMADNGNYSFSDSYVAEYVLFDAGDSGYDVPYTDDSETPEDETSVVLGDPLMLLCGKPGVDDPYGPDSKNQETGIKLAIDYTFGDNRKSVAMNLLNPDLSFSPQVGVNYTFQLNWIGDGLVLLVMPSSNAQWGDGEADDGETGNDDIIFE